jgi:purine-binding chemotaxis protein CheW
MKRTSINWDQVRARLQASEKALEDSRSESPDQIATAYRQRAKRLALEDVERKPVSAGLPALVFGLGEERYAVALEELAEVLPFERCAAVPGAPPPFQGVINLRGELRTVVDLRSLLLASETEEKDSGFVLMLRRPGREIGFRVDSVEELREIRLEELASPLQGTYVKGTIAGALILLSVDAVLAHVFSDEGSTAGG